MKAPANLESSVLEPKRYTTDYYKDTYYYIACREFGREGGVVRQVSGIQMAELEEACH